MPSASPEKGHGDLKGVFGLLPTPYTEDFEIHTDDLRAAAEFCCASGQHGVVWPVMVGQFYYVGEQERIRHLDAVLETVNGRLPVVFGCSGISVPQVLVYARAAQAAGADAIIAMAPSGTTPKIAKDMFRRLADVYDGPIILQNAADYVPLTSEEVAEVVDDVPQVAYVKEERPPGRHHISELHNLVGDKVKTIFGGGAGLVMLEDVRRGANGCMPACELGDVLARIMELWWAGDEAGARDLHQRLLPLIVRERWPFMRYILKRRGVFTSLVERAPNGMVDVDADEKREISILLEPIKDDIVHYPFGPE